MNGEMYSWYKKDYPETLKNMPYVPEQMYVRGNLRLEKNQKFLCVIGSRRATTHGRDCVNKILSGLRGYPISIVSGLAQGMDSYAHEAALAAHLHCIAFPGSNLSWDSMKARNPILPRQIIAAGGALVSRWPHDYEVGNWGFPARNRLMAGISHAVLIIEATRGSGSLLTAEHALEYNRDVMVVPGSILAELSYGPHMLARTGAALITSSEDLLKELGFTPSKNKNRLAILETLDGLARKIYSEISLDGNITTDTIQDRLSLDALTLNQKLTELELEGLIKMDGDMLKLV